MQRIVIFYYRTWVCMRVCRRTRVSHFLLIITTTHLIALAIKNAWFAFADFFFFFLLFFSPHRLHDGGRVKARARASSTSQKRPWSPVVCVFFFFGAHAHSGNRKPESAKRREEEGKNGRFISKNFSHWKKKNCASVILGGREDPSALHCPGKGGENILFDPHRFFGR